jgi:hypothetical protein
MCRSIDMNMKLLFFFCSLAQVAVAQSLSAVLHPPYTGEGACCMVQVAQSAATSASPDSSTNVQSGTGDPGAVKAKQLIDQMIQALGGDAYLRISDVTQEGRTNGFYHGTPSGGTAPFWRFYKFPDKERVELTKRRDWIVIHNGERGTETTFHGTKPEDDDAHREYLLRDQYSMENVLRKWLNAPGTVLFYDGTGFTDNHQVENVTIANAQNQQETFSIDEFTHLPVRKSYTVRDPKYKDKDTYADIYSEYRPIQGIQTPHVITRMKNDEMTSQRFLTKVSYNQGLKDDLFVPPTSMSKRK